MQVTPVMTKKTYNRITDKNGQRQEKLPEFYCMSCNNKQADNYCNCFKRHIDPQYNKCFNHSNYISVPTTFKPNPELDEIVRQEAEEQKKFYV